VRRAVVDASVAVKWVVEEPYTAEALRALETYEMVAPCLIHSEVASALSKKALRGELEPDEAIAKMDEIAHADVGTVSDEHLAVAAVRLAQLLQHPVYDCFYLALAQAESVPVITADVGLMTAARNAGLEDGVVWIGDVE
jgi:predicted nucleic acid-binding protein